MTELDLSTEMEADIDFKAVKHRFVLLNQQRLQRTRSALKERQKDFLDLLPLLFHVNHPLLPGYASKFTPCGVWGYTPDRKVLNRARVLARSFAYKKPTKKHSPILALYFMGSSGTIAHSGESDFDIWLCHESRLMSDELSNLQQKASGIEAWAETLGLEIHFFLINPETFRRGGQSALSAESSGSAQQGLLLDEFYRTSVLLEGQCPLWWLVPPQYDAAYDLYVEEMQRKRFLYARDTIDFGGLSHIPAEEFFGAALWQLSKGIDAPYKAILKLLLIETYAREYPAVELLSKCYKQSVYDGVIELDRLDSYILMMQKVSDYLMQNNEPKRLELARRCFYFKVGLRLGEQLTDKGDEWRYNCFLAMTKMWGWSHTDLLLMDAHRQWRVHRVLEEREQLFQALLSSYRLLSDFVRNYSGLSLISEGDLTTLGRKLYSAYERKAGKIEIITRGVDAELSEPQVTLLELGSGEADRGWQVFSGVVSENRLHMEEPIKRTRSLTELIGWCHLNGITTHNTTYVVHSQHSSHTPREIENLATRIAHHFPLSTLHSGTIDEYSTSARVTLSEFYINTGVRLSDSMLMTKNIAATGHADPFCFGYQGESLVLAVDQLSLNSWREVMAYRFSGNDAVLDAICNHLKWYPVTAAERPPIPGFYSGVSALGGAVAKRVEELFKEVIDCFYQDAGPNKESYLVSIGSSHYSLFIKGGIVHYEALSGSAALFSYLAKAQPRFFSVEFDKHTLRESFLPAMYEENRSGLIQCFFNIKGNEVEIFVLDEKGSLYHQHTPYHDEQALLNQFSCFFEAVSNRLNLMQQEDECHGEIKGAEFYRMSRDAIGRRQVKRISPELCSPSKNYFSLQVIVEKDGKGESIFTLYCDGKEFSTLEHGKALFTSVVKHVLVLRQSGQRYPIYITDISLARSVVGEENVGKMQSIHFSNYKRRIEEQLNRAMKGG